MAKRERPVRTQPLMTPRHATAPPDAALRKMELGVRRLEVERARTAHWLLDELYQGGCLSSLVDPIPAVNGSAAPSESDKDRAWHITRMALHELDEALTELTGYFKPNAVKRGRARKAGA